MVLDKLLKRVQSEDLAVTPDDYLLSKPRFLDEYIQYCTQTNEGFNFSRLVSPTVLESAAQILDGFVVLGQHATQQQQLRPAEQSGRGQQEAKYWQAEASTSSSVLFEWRARREGSIGSHMTSMLTPNLSEQSLGATSSSSRSDHGHSSPASKESKASASSADMDEEVADRQGITAGISKTSRSSNPQRQQPTKRSTSGILKTPLIRNAIPSFHSLNSQDALTNEKDLERITSENTLTNSRTRLTVPQLHNRTAGNLSSVPERQLWDTQDLLEHCFPTGIPCCKRNIQAFKGLSPVEEARFEPMHLKSEEGNAVLRFRSTSKDSSTSLRSSRLSAEENSHTTWAICVYREEPAVDKPSFCSHDDASETKQDPQQQHGKQEETMTVRCYCLLSRLPFFELHFFVLYCILEEERLYRLESVATSHALQILRQYSRLDVPSLGETITFTPRNGELGSCSYNRPRVPEGLPWKSTSSDDYYEIHQTVIDSYDPVVEILVQDCRGTVELSKLGAQHLDFEGNSMPDGRLESKYYRYRVNASTYTDVAQWQHETEEASAIGLWAIRALASSLSADSLCKVLSAILLEYQVAFVGENYGVVSAAVLATLPLLWPFRPSSVEPVVDREKLDTLLPPNSESHKPFWARYCGHRETLDSSASPFVIGCVEPEIVKERARGFERLMVIDLNRKTITHSPRGLPPLSFHHQLVVELDKHMSKLFRSNNVGPSPLVRASSRATKMRHFSFGSQQQANSSFCSQPLHIMNQEALEDCAGVLGVFRTYISHLCRQVCNHTISQVTRIADDQEVPLKGATSSSSQRGLSTSDGNGDHRGLSPSQSLTFELDDASVNDADSGLGHGHSFRNNASQLLRTRVLLEIAMINDMPVTERPFLKQFLQTSTFANFSMAARPSLLMMGRAFLAAMPMLTTLRMSSLERMLRNMRKKKRRQGKIIFRQGDRPDGIYFVTIGRLGVYRKSSGKRGLGEQIATIAPGQFFGEMSVIDDSGGLRKRSATIQALSNVELLFLPLKQWRELLDETPRAKRRMEGLVRKRYMENLLRQDSNLVRLCPLFMETEHGIAELLLDQMFLTHMKTGEFVIRKGDVGDRMFYIVRGTVNVIIEPDSSREEGSKVASQRIPLSIGDFFGEMALLQIDNERTADVQCETDCDLLCLTSDDFNRVIMASDGKTIERINAIATERRKASQLISKGYRDMLRACGLFQNLPEEAIEQLFKDLDIDTYSSGAYITREGDAGTCMWIVYNGQVEIMKNEEGTSTIVSVLGVGQYFGEIALLVEDGVRNADVRARGSVMLLKLEKDSFDLVRRSNTEVDEMVLSEAQNRLRGLKEAVSQSSLSRSQVL